MGRVQGTVFLEVAPSCFSMPERVVEVSLRGGVGKAHFERMVSITLLKVDLDSSGYGGSSTSSTAAATVAFTCSEEVSIMAVWKDSSSRLEEAFGG